MGRASKAAASGRVRNQPESARLRLAAGRVAAQRRAEVRRRLLIAGGSVAIVLVFVAAPIVVKLNQSAPAAPQA